MAIEKTVENEKAWRRLEFARVLVGVAVVVATLAVIVSGVLAFRDGRDAWLAMRWPIAAAVLLAWAFVRIVRTIVALPRDAAR